MSWKDLLFSPRGRINRAKYWLGSLSVVLGLVVVCGLLTGLAVMTADPDSSPTTAGIAAYVIAAVIYCVGIYVHVMIGIKRFHDRGKSGWWMLIVLIPYIGSIWIFVECGCLPGTDGRNRFGADPLARNADVVGVFDAPEQTTLR